MESKQNIIMERGVHILLILTHRRTYNYLPSVHTAPATVDTMLDIIQHLAVSKCVYET